MTPDPSPAVTSDPAVMGGEPCIAGTRVPVRTVKSFVELGYSLAAVMAEYPGLTRAQVEAALAWQPPPDPAADARLVAEELGAGWTVTTVPYGLRVWQHGAGVAATLIARDALVRLARRCREQRDDPELDATDGAHPAWWRGNDAGVAGACRVLAAVLDGSDGGSGVVGSEPLEMLRRRLIGQREELERLRARVAELEHLRGETGDGPAVSEDEAVRTIR
jgi:uncharacterized protein (DUF433 family)